MELNNFNEFIVETRDPMKNHDFCCGCIQIPLSIPTSIIGVLGLIKMIISLIYRDVLGRNFFSDTKHFLFHFISYINFMLYSNSLLFCILGGLFVFIAHGIWAFLFIIFALLWFCRFDFMGDMKKTFKILKIHMATLTFTGLVVNLIMIVLYFNHQESWEVESASAIAILCFCIFDMLVNLTIGINTYCCQVTEESIDEFD